MQFEFTIDEANVILSALGSQPYTSVASVIEKMMQQAKDQIEEQDVPAVEES